MPLRSGRLTRKELEFVKYMARHNDEEYAATKAGYSFPRVAGHKLKSNPAIAEATFEEVRKFLRNQGAAIGVYTLAELAIDEKVPAGVRRAAAVDLAKLSGVGVAEGEGDKEPHEMTADELARYRSKMERQLDAINQAAADRAKPVLDVKQESNPKSSVFG